jgi:hypothetical protein
VAKQHSDASARPRKVSRRQADQARAQLAAGGLSHQERRQLRSVTSARDSAARRRRGELRHLLIVAAGTIAAMAVAGAALGLVPAIEAASRQGTAGTFVPGNQPCITSGRTGCAWSGTFRPRNGAIVQHVSYDGTLPADAAGGSGVPAIYPEGSSHIVYPPHGSRAWVTDLLVMVLIGGIAGLLLWIFPIGLGERETSGAII